VNTLRAKLAILIAVVIISVVSILTGVLIYLLGPPGKRQAIGPLTDQVQLLAGIARAAPALVSIQQKPAEGEVETDVTSWLRETLEARGVPRDAVVSRNSRDMPMLSIPVDQGWLITQITDLPPPGGVINLILKWLALIALGAMAIALFLPTGWSGLSSCSKERLSR
jgi:hypothetical protein